MCELGTFDLVNHEIMKVWELRLLNEFWLFDWVLLASHSLLSFDSSLINHQISITLHAPHSQVPSNAEKN